VLNISIKELRQIEAARKIVILRETTDWLLGEFEIPFEKREGLLAEVITISEILDTWKITDPDIIRMHCYVSLSLGRDYYTVALIAQKVLSSDVEQDTKAEWMRKWIKSLQERTAK
jgi:hypothetical protein